jgi:hypothetical protein
MRRTQFAVRECGHDRTGGWIECAGGNKTECESRRQRIGENASKGDQQRDCTPHDEVAVYCERRHHDDHGRAVCHHSGPLDRPPERQTSSTALRDCRHG